MRATEHLLLAAGELIAQVGPALGETGKHLAGLLRTHSAYRTIVAGIALFLVENRMTDRNTPPFRADHVGSFLRPKYLLDARAQAASGATIAKPDGTQELAPPVMRVVDKVRHVKDIQKADFEYLKSQVSAGHTPKVTIPSPTMLHFRGGRAGISKQHYPELDPAFYDDVATAYGDEMRSLAAAGCTYVQMDDTNLAYLCDDKMREAARGRGDDPDELLHRYASFINRVVARTSSNTTTPAPATSSRCASCPRARR